jgi:hypothetical protein
VIEQLEDRLHALDRDINELRRQIWMTKNGLTRSEDWPADVARLEEQVREVSDLFVETYRAWSRQHAAE